MVGCGRRYVELCLNINDPHSSANGTRARAWTAAVKKRRGREWARPDWARRSAGAGDWPRRTAVSLALAMLPSMGPQEPYRLTSRS